MPFSMNRPFPIVLISLSFLFSFTDLELNLSFIQTKINLINSLIACHASALAFAMTDEVCQEAEVKA